METEQSVVQNELGYIKLYKMRNYYNWEIKLHEGKDESLFNDILEKIERLNNEMLCKFSGDMQ